MCLSVPQVLSQLHGIPAEGEGADEQQEEQQPSSRMADLKQRSKSNGSLSDQATASASHRTGRPPLAETTVNNKPGLKVRSLSTLHDECQPQTGVVVYGAAAPACGGGQLHDCTSPLVHAVTLCFVTTCCRSVHMLRMLCCKAVPSYRRPVLSLFSLPTELLTILEPPHSC